VIWFKGDVTEQGGKGHKRSRTKAPPVRIQKAAPTDPAILKRGREQPWETRTTRGWPHRVDVYAFIQETYLRDWPQITAADIARANPALYAYYNTRKARVGVPKGFKLLAGAEARDAKETDPRRSIYREMERERKRQAATSRAAKSKKRAPKVKAR
jgi:hypothetical protein